MPKLAVLSGAYKNAGDFLIVKRSVELLKYVYPECEIVLYERRLPLSEQLDEINKMDAVILAGGPGYSPNIYPKEIPLVEDLSQIKVPIYTIGLGWYGRNSAQETIYQKYLFGQGTRRLLERLQVDGALSCRDGYSFRVLKANGYTRSVITGCPAWYDINKIDSTILRDGISLPYRKICVSDPANPSNYTQSAEIVRFLRGKYPSASILYVFHRGRTCDNLDVTVQKMHTALMDELKRNHVETVDISSSADGFSVYDDCDLHVGMRVHAHIYNLSIRNISVLVEEDGRGAGVNEILGLPRIKSYSSFGKIPSDSLLLTDRILRRICRRLYGNTTKNNYLLLELDDYLEMLERNDYIMLRQAFAKQKSYYNEMLKHIQSFFPIEEGNRK